MNKNYFIWTEAVKCGEILAPMIESYLSHHDYPLHVFATDEDFQYISHIKNPLIRYCSLNSISKSLVEKIERGYKKGHLGTAKLWSYLIRNQSERFYIHLDADTIFLDNVTNEIKYSLQEGKYALVGSRRPYKYRTYRLTGRDAKALNRLPDVVNTDCFGFDRSFFRISPEWLLTRKILGRRQFRRPIIDFFDPISFEILDNGGLIHYLDSQSDGVSASPNLQSNFHSKRISFSAVGSGLNFYKNPSAKSSAGYKKFALSSFSLYSNLILKIPIDIPMLDDSNLIKRISKLDRTTWKIS